MNQVWGYVRLGYVKLGSTRLGQQERHLIVPTKINGSVKTLPRKLIPICSRQSVFERKTSNDDVASLIQHYVYPSWDSLQHYYWYWMDGWMADNGTGLVCFIYTYTFIGESKKDSVERRIGETRRVNREKHAHETNRKEMKKSGQI